LWRLALPSLAEQFLVFFIGLVDTWLSGRIGTDASAAVGLASYVDWLASLRARAGFSVLNVLVYGTGGVAVGASSYALSYHGQTLTRAGGTHSGFVAGGGVEARVLPGMSLRLEGLHYMFGSEAFAFDGVAGGTNVSIRDSLAPSFTTVRLGLSFALN
jgi:opacity protein-like surface antigen